MVQFKFDGITGSDLVNSTSAYTIGPVGRDFTRFEEAMDAVRQKVLMNDLVTFSVDPGTYPETFTASGLVGRRIVFVGDIRELCGFAYRNLASLQSTTANSGSGIITIVTAPNTYTVTGTIANPDFVAAGIVAGDQIAVRDDAGNFHLLIIQNVAPTVLTFAALPPAISTINAGFAVCPNRIITQDTLPSFAFTRMHGVSMWGFLFLDQSLNFINMVETCSLYFSVFYTTGAVAQVLTVGSDDFVSGQNAFVGENLKININSVKSALVIDTAAWIKNTVSGLFDIDYVNNFFASRADIVGDHIVFPNIGIDISHSPGVFLSGCRCRNFDTHVRDSFSHVSMQGGILDNGQYGIFNSKNGVIDHITGEVRNMSIEGFHAEDGGFIDVAAGVVLAGNLADYSPAASGVFGNNGAMIVHP